MQKTEHFRVKNAVGEEFSYTSKITVGSEGIFRAVVPDELKPFAAQIGSSHAATKHTKGTVSVDFRHAQARVCAETMHDCMQVLKNLGHMYLAMEVTKELVIIYDFKAEFSLYQFADGTLEPNGVSSDEAKRSEGGKWVEGTERFHSGNRMRAAALGLGAEIRVKVTRTRGEKKDVSYESAREHGNEEFLNSIGPEGKELMRYDVSVRTPESWHGNVRSAVKNEMPYSEEAALFFHSSMYQISLLGMRVNAFFSDEEQLTSAIANMAQLQLGAGAGNAG